MSKVDVDSHGRIYLPKKYRDEHGDKFKIVSFEGELRLIPIPEDPVEDLRERTENLRDSDKSVKELKQEARDQIREEAGE